ncbi:MAG: 30S ribosomal protein S8 [Phycisphaeraceae bacterium]|nr:30S ribosomal protein S8 [Phycisphaeraceae bacterium]MBX3367198.1 30S ribosomal protein S8 [Phycisphaeraceae bacterium]MCW5769876.1 30S ribosomal protein S8 [Phycisphaeraceae bacterium]QYK49452.1 MAG: 30S ribosomal protein S8 [Phycisphaeraceae bacterium]
MAISDPIADMLTRIRNGLRNRAKTVNCLNSKVCRGIADVLRDEGYITSYDVIEDGRQGIIRLHMKYGPSGEALISRITRSSKPGCRVYAAVDEIPRPLQGLGIAVVSTSRGVLSDRKCRTERVGGELLCVVE